MKSGSAAFASILSRQICATFATVASRPPLTRIAVPSWRFISSASAALPSRNSPAISRSRSRLLAYRDQDLRYGLVAERPVQQRDYRACGDALALPRIADHDQLASVLLPKLEQSQEVALAQLAESINHDDAALVELIALRAPPA